MRRPPARARPFGWLPVVVAAVLVMGSLAGLTVVAVDRSATAVTSQVEGRAQDATAAAGAFVRGEVELLEQLVTSYAQQPQVRAAVAADTGQAGASDLTAALRQLQQSVPGLVAAWVSDENGILLTNHLGASPSIGHSLGYRDWYRGARHSTEPYLSSGYVNRNAARTPGFAVSIAVRGPHGPDEPVVGVLAVSMGLKAFASVFDHAAPRGGSMLVTDQNGRVLASPGTPRPLLSDQSDDPGVRAAIEGRSTLHREDGWVQTHAPLGRGWTVSTSLPASLADRPNAQLATAIGAAGAGAGLCLLGALLLLARVLRSRARAERELAAALSEVEHRDRYTHTVLDTLDVSVVVCDRTGTLTYVNRLARAWHGIDELAPDSEVESWGSRYRITHVDGRSVAAHEWPLIGAMATREPASAELLLGSAGQPPRRIVVLARPLLAGDGTVLGAVSGAHDVTATRRQEAELVQARDTAMQAAQAKTSFLAAMSHEIRTPLHGVLGMLDIVLTDPILPGDVREQLDVAAASGQTLLRLLNDVLDMSRADATRLTLTRRPTDLPELVRSAVAVLSGPAQVKGLTLTVALDPCLPDQTSTDPDRLTQVLLNLVGNAVKFTDRGAVTVTATTTPGDDPLGGRPGSDARHLVLHVTDSGPGMTEEETRRIFRPFEQGTAGRASGGAGLGLALTAQLVELFAGRITVQSEPGRGSTFTVTLPLVETARRTAQARPDAPADPLPPLNRMLARTTAPTSSS